MEGKSLTLEQLAELTNSKLVGNPKHIISNVADLDSATASEASFLSNPRYTPTRYESAMKSSQAGVIFIAPSVSPIKGRNFLISDDPTHAFQKTIEAVRGGTQNFSAFADIHPSAVIHETAKIGENVTIGPNAVIDGYVVIGENTMIGAGCYIGPQTSIGSNSVLHANVTIREQCKIGNHVIIQPGAVIGGCGFGYATNDRGEHTKLNHVGNVVIEDNVEIGSNATIDRARFTSTTIGAGTKIDNLVTIAHNVKLGKNNLIAGQAGIAGSAETGACVVLAGQTAIAGHLKVASGVILSGKGGITKSIEKPGVYGGVPATPMREFNKQQVLLRQIDKLVERVKQLEKR